MVVVSNECAFDGSVLATTVDNGDGTGTRTVFDGNGDVVSVTQLVGLEVRTFPPLDALGRMATLSAILHDDVADWANASGIPAEHLIAEAEAWSLGQQ